MARSNNFIEKLRQYPLIAAGALIIVGVAAYQISGNQRPEYFERAGVISNTSQNEPSSDAKAVEKLLTGQGDGIISFEMYVPSPKKSSVISLSREEMIQQIIEAVSALKDDVKVQNTIISRVTALKFKLGGSELAAILRSSQIKDPFYYANVIKRIAPLLEYPMTERQMKAIVEPIKDNYYKHKLYGELVKEQLRHR
jgi:hypothetical protein